MTRTTPPSLILTAVGSAVLSGCALLGAVPPAEAEPSPAALRPPARWERRFCEAQEWVAVARVRMTQAHNRMDGTQDREVLEDLGDDAADTAQRALDFLSLVPDWGPGDRLLQVERSMLRSGIRAGELLEEMAESGSISASGRRPARIALNEMRGEMRLALEAGRRGRTQGIPCAVPKLAPLVPEGVGIGGPMEP